jgi:hypothetical protein
MARTLRTLLAFCVIPVFLAGGVVVVHSQSNTESKMVRAMIGVQIKSGEQTLRAKKTEVLKAGDGFQIHIRPEGDLHVYIVRSDRKTVTLLKAIEPGGFGSELVLPAPQEYYEVSGESVMESITVICSPDELTEVSGLLESRPSYEKWSPIEQELIVRGGIDLDTVSEKPFPIAGAVKETMGRETPERETPRSNKIHSPVGEFPIFSGNTLLVKQYVFTIKK